MAAAAAETAKPSAAHAFFGGRSNTSNSYDYAFPASYNTAGSNTARRKLQLNTTAPSSKSRTFGDVYNSAGASPASASPASYFPPRTDSRTAGAKMSSSHVGGGGARSESRHAKLHKRGGSGSSIPGSSLPASSSALSQGGSTWEDSYTSTSSTPTGSMPKIRPYLRKMSTKDDTEQGRLDLSKSMSENQALTGLGIQDLGQRSASDVSFTHTAKRSHARTTSGESQHSTASGSMRPTNKPFVHPMRQTPRPYTPPHGHSFDSSTLNDEERNESDDVLTDDDFRLGHGFRPRRSVSISSTPVIAPTPLSQSHTALDLGMVPKLTSSSLGNANANASQTNLSIKSNRSGKSSKSRPSASRSRRNTERSFDTPTGSTSARTSFDKAFSFASVGGGRRSDTDPLTRDQRIQAARRKFEEKEERKEIKRRETEEAKRRKSEASERTKKSGEKARGGGKRGEELGRWEGGEKTPYASAAAGAEQQQQSGGKKVVKEQPADEAPKPGKFGTWLKMTVLSCGKKG